MGGATHLLPLPAAGPAVKLSPPISFSTSYFFLSARKPAVAASKASRCRSCLTAGAGGAVCFSPPAQPASAAATVVSDPPARRWMVVMEKPSSVVGASRAEVIDYYVQTLARVFGSEKEAQMCIYDASWKDQFGFCCEIAEEESRELARMPGVFSVRPDKDEECRQKNYNKATFLRKDQLHSDGYNSRFSSSLENSKYWLVRIEKPGVEVVTKAQMVDYYAQILTKVLGNEQDAQVCIYNISWEKDYGFCCHIDEKCARELADVPGVLSVQLDTNFASENKDYRGHYSDPIESNRIPNVRTKRLFVTGLSFYTSEKTLRAAFEGFGELVEVKIIMDKISKRSKGYAFIEYMTEEAAGAALKEMNGKIINGWMIVVDVARTNPPRNSREPARQSSTSAAY